MQILLIDVPRPDIPMEGVGLVEITHPSLGLSYIAAVLEQNGFDVSLLDAFNLKLTLKDIQETLAQEQFDVVGLTCVTPTYPIAAVIAGIVKEINENTKVVIGGPHVTFTYEDILNEEEAIDIVVRGEGEQTMLELVRTLEKGGDLSDVDGISYREGDNMVVTPDRPFIKELDSLPFPARHLWHENIIDRLTEMPIISSRGCPFSCLYCSTSCMWGHEIRYRGTKNLIDEMEDVVNNFNIRRFIFNDDVFTLNKNKVFEICDEIEKRDLGIHWACSSRTDTVSKDMLERMKRAGCDTIYYGIESGNPKVLGSILKKTTLEQAKNAVKWADEAGIVTIASFIIGFPGEMPGKDYVAWSKKTNWIEKEDKFKGDVSDSIYSSLQFAEGLGADINQVHLLTPFPGTDVYDRMEELGIKLLTKDWEMFNLQFPVIETTNLSVDDIVNAYTLYLDKFNNLNISRRSNRRKKTDKPLPINDSSGRDKR